MYRTRNEALLADTRVARTWPLIVALVAAVLAAGLAGLVLLRGGSTSFDTAWMMAVREDPNGILFQASMLLNSMGGGIIAWVVIPVVGIAGLILAKRYWGALYWAISLGLSAVVVQVVKHLILRERPAEMLVVSDAGSFPSGHTANAATIAIVLGILFRRAWVWVAGMAAIVVMALSRTYLGAHWVSDTVGGALIGLCVAIVVWAALAVPLLRERLRVRG
ncbi:phosphatase PAP2 family protein [Paramicrobacterium sp. CJ85]|uniref:phosphatase PAP2 family protein n=1 Tax=Paramicrobacterium sp. CJ85 TaxID=3445355 RepID=UPI003F609110